MATKLVVVAHGIGDTPAGFEKDWEAILRKNHPDGDFQVAGLWWADLLDQMMEKYPDISNNFAAAVAKFGFDGLQKMLDNQSYQLIRTYYMDVLVYVGLPEMTRAIQAECSVRLADICKGNEANCILIGHSLGAAMLPHIVWWRYHETDYIPYNSLLLLASPLGMRSPKPSLIGDPLQMLGEIQGEDRPATLGQFAGAWNTVGDGRLKFFINQNDLVCWDVKYNIGGKLVDIIPFVQKGFNDTELNILRDNNPGCVQTFTAGNNVLGQITANHALALYLNRPEFKQVFEQLLAT